MTNAGESSGADIPEKTAAANACEVGRLLAHVDSLGRYTDVADENCRKDHHLRSDDGLRTTWSPVEEPSFMKKYWKRVQEAPVDVLEWTFIDWIEAKPRRTRIEANGSQRQIFWSPAWRTLYWKYAVSCLGLTLTALFGNFEGRVHMAGRYSPVSYKYRRNPDEPRNKSEIRNAEGGPQPDPPTDNTDRADEFDGAFGRHLRPRFLCLTPDIDEDGNEIHRDKNPFNVVTVDEWDKQWQRDKDATHGGAYVFVSYTRREFQTYNEEQVGTWGVSYSDRVKYNKMYLEDLEHLYRIGVEAAKSAGLRAVWIDVLCLEKDTAIFDSHRICDIARGSNRMVIAVEQKVSDRLGGAVLPKLPEGLDDLLQEWAARLWTLPEMLLAPAHHGFEIYAFVDTARLLTHIPKRNMAERAYGVDGRMVRELVDHMEGNLHLTQIELLTRGLDVVMKRPKSQYMNADAIYALMTLSRRRPKPDTNTSEFKAFSRLSLLNDSNLLLERLICILPRCRGTPWHDMQDYWGARLWDIYPMCQVAAVEDDDTVMLDGAFGASIEWGRLSRVGFLKRKTAWRTVADIFVRSAPGWLLIGIVTLATYAKPIDVYTGLGGVKKTTNPFIAVGIVFFLIGVATVAVLPYALLSLYRGKFWSTQAMFFGLEGTVTDLDWLEKQLFGFSEGRLKWSPYASTQTRHRIKTAGEHINDECEGEMPVELPLEVATGVSEKIYNHDGTLTLRKHLPDGTFTLKTYSSDSPYGPFTERQYSPDGAFMLDLPPGNDDPDQKLSPMIEPDRLFTLVDTYNMNVITFRAVHPPSAALVCGHEGGMRRAILCSYEYSTQAFHREAVLRLSTKVLDRMDRVDRLRFSMKSKSEPRTGPAPA